VGRRGVRAAGSEHHVANLTEPQIEDIALYLNFDMFASPNYFFGVYDGDNSSNTAPAGFIPPGSAQIEDVFERFYADGGRPLQDTEFSGRSDYGQFVAVGVPAGGLFTGAEGVKTAIKGRRGTSARCTPVPIQTAAANEARLCSGSFDVGDTS
jgi:Zn-dependent M28 family amino/carboxypeptidase